MICSAEIRVWFYSFWMSNSWDVYKCDIIVVHICWTVSVTTISNSRLICNLSTSVVVYHPLASFNIIIAVFCYIFSTSLSPWMLFSIYSKFTMDFRFRPLILTVCDCWRCHSIYCVIFCYICSCNQKCDFVAYFHDFHLLFHVLLCGCNLKNNDIIA